MSETKVHFGWPAELLERMEELLGEEFRDYRESLSEEGWERNSVITERVCQRKAGRLSVLICKRPAAGKRSSKHCGLQ